MFKWSSRKSDIFLILANIGLITEKWTLNLDSPIYKLSSPLLYAQQSNYSIKAGSCSKKNGLRKSLYKQCGPTSDSERKHYHWQPGGGSALDWVGNCWLCRAEGRNWRQLQEKEKCCTTKITDPNKIPCLVIILFRDEMQPQTRSKVTWSHYGLFSNAHFKRNQDKILRKTAIVPNFLILFNFFIIF